ncbi:ribosomal lysine N-methyltransferase [Diplogelasinospora grovesii]|uniref:Ribosomal lysine N-methyltransferase n=1 Tax=Diplogelasinospora grovesii TaxID=303347 RepID=A0AAN6N609_9PEZI|nr:ribosomal lysine N-methyltransferase [Diplogelasinospora grovesii]
MEIDGGVDAVFDQCTQFFLQWFRTLPGATFHRDIRIEDLRGRNAGRGIVATADIEPDTVLFTIPRASIICTATSSLPNRIPEVFDTSGADGNQSEDDDDDEDDPKSQDSWTSLILIMLYEYLQGSSSRWKPYLDVLPAKFDTPMFWSPAELAELQASSVVLKIGKTEADQMIKRKILPVIRAHENVFFPSGSASLSDDQLVELSHRMGSAIMAYAFDLEKDDEDEAGREEDDDWVEDREGKTMLGMVPMADILNADAVFNAHISHGEDALTATSLRPIRAGEEILNYYGPLSNGELLRRYGYVTAEHSRYDVVELPWELIERRLKERFVALKSQDWEKVANLMDPEDTEDSFVIERVSEDPDSSGVIHGEAQVRDLPEELEEQVKDFLKAVKKVHSQSAEALSDKNARKEIYLDSVLRALRDREAQYGTTLENDEGLLKSEQPNGRRDMAVWVRRGEKRLLREAQVWVAQQLAELELSTSRPTSSAPTAKRQRI